MGGDFNATYDCSDVNINIDVLNMVNIPSSRRSNRIKVMCTNLSLIDPYRLLYPNTRDYTFTPMGENQLNRSRLDFFLISDHFSELVKNVIIPHSLSSTTFDHKNVSLLFAKRPSIFNFFVKDCTKTDRPELMKISTLSSELCRLGINKYFSQILSGIRA